MDKLGAIFATFVTALFLGGCMVYGASANNSPVEQARGDAIRIQAEADRAVQMMYANQDAADRTAARNSGTNWPAIMVAVIVFQSIVFVAILLFVLSYQRKAIQRNDIVQAGIIKVGSAQYIVHRDQHGQGIPYLEEIHHE